MKQQWIDYLRQNTTDEEVNLVVDSLAILLPFESSIDTDPATQRVNEILVQKNTGLLTYETFLRKNKVDSFLDGN